jgi:6-pyruvoyltetrahydropterin/6-carboxytetrahydropterin synthase
MKDLTITTLELFKENMSFSAGHFTILSATEREKLHGHNYGLYVAFTTKVLAHGMASDYRIYKQKLRKLCKQVDEVFLLPKNSPFLKIEEEGDYYYVHFHTEKIPFLKNDVLILPLRNITIEELASWFLQQLTADMAEIEGHQIYKITVKISSGPGQSASAEWKIE